MRRKPRGYKEQENGAVSKENGGVSKENCAFPCFSYSLQCGCHPKPSVHHTPKAKRPWGRTLQRKAASKPEKWSQKMTRGANQEWHGCSFYIFDHLCLVCFYLYRLRPIAQALGWSLKGVVKQNHHETKYLRWCGCVVGSFGKPKEMAKDQKFQIYA